MAHKETDLQKVIAEVKASLKDKELKDLADHVLDKVNHSNGNIAGILNDSALQSTLQNLLQNKNLANMLNNPNLSSQIASFLNNPGNTPVVEELKRALDNSEKKKINNAVSAEELQRLKEDLLVKYNNHRYEKQRNWIETITPFLASDKQKSLQSVYNLFLFKEVWDSIKNSDKSLLETPIEIESTPDITPDCTPDTSVECDPENLAETAN